jgi:hypothetical protein
MRSPSWRAASTSIWSAGYWRSLVRRIRDAVAWRRRRRRVAAAAFVPIIAPLRPTLERLTDGRRTRARLLTGPRDGVITTATLRDATGWDELVTGGQVSGRVPHADAET